MSDYQYKDRAFTIKNYNRKKPFANFLPGVAGKMGIPLWAFYVNRGQALASFGLQDKNHPILPFTPANKAYENTPITGFRTFIKCDKEVYEPFTVDTKYEHAMTIEQAAFTIEETNPDLGLSINVKYFGLPNEPIAGLVRKVTITNTSSKAREFEILDGISEILAAGIQNEAFKAVSNVLASWIDVEHLERQVAYYTLRGSTGDSSEVGAVEEGNFYLGVVNSKRVRPIVDTALVFGYNTAKTTPIAFIESSLESIINQKQVTTNKIPCGFIPVVETLKPKQSIEIYSVSGHVKRFEILQELLPSLSDRDVLMSKEDEASKIVQSLLQDVKSSTNLPIFDDYIEQNYLDNFLRGGYPIKIGNTIYHLYSRRHGDLERDYNFFSLAPEYYSQGAGNFRDVCQNRRLDSVIHREVSDFNIHHFASLIQLDGYNPLSVGGINFKLKEEIDKRDLVSKLFENHTDKIIAFLEHPFTPGNVVNFIEAEGIVSKIPIEAYLDEIINHSTPSINAAFGEGYWIDHFTYIIDLVESFENIYPDKMSKLLFDEEKYLYFESPVTVLPKESKMVLNKNHKVRQYNSLRHFDEEKIARLNMNRYASHWSRLGDNVYQSNLYVKLLILAMNKHSLLDPDGFGVEMEAEKPGWNDAMNGLPGLIGSGVSETIELWRIVRFLAQYSVQGSLELPYEVHQLFESLWNHKTYQERLNLRHTYRDAIRFGLSGKLVTLEMERVKNYLDQLKETIEEKLMVLYRESEGIIPTFLYYNVTSYEALLENGKPIKTQKGYDVVKPSTYERKQLPRFLEAPARLLKTDFPKDRLAQMNQSIKASDIYDQNLKMFKTSECIENESVEIGRIHAFTKGWLERESNFLHMTYKYLLGLLKAGLYEEYYQELETNLVCFMNPEVYGRSTLENSSFIAPSNNPDSTIHGQGFFARLSGSTVEALNMWTLMMMGEQPFKMENQDLVLKFEPKLAKKFFKKDNTVVFKFMRDTEVVYINESNENTYERCEIYRYVLIQKDGVESIVEGDALKGVIASNVRDGLYKKIKIYMNKK